jgi:hypothetical protein
MSRISVLFYTLLHRKKMNMEENRSIWQYLEFPKICPAEHSSRIDPKELEDDIKWKSDKHESCGGISRRTI